MLATAAPWTSPWLPPGYAQNFWNGASVQRKIGNLKQSVRFETFEVIATEVA
jgi:hypothetical protein